MSIVTLFLSIFFKLPLGFLITVALLVTSIALIPFDRSGERQRALAPLWARCMLLICGIKVRTQGLEKLARNRQYIFVSNHASWVDIAVLLACLPQQLCFFAKTELFRLPLVGTCLRRSRQIPIDRKHPLPAASRLRLASRMLSRNSHSLVLFPEGTRSSNGLLQFKNGAAYIASHSGIPIVPIGLTGTRQLMPRGSAIIRSGTVGMNVGSPVQSKDCSPEIDLVSLELRVSVGELLNRGF